MRSKQLSLPAPVQFKLGNGTGWLTNDYYRFWWRCKCCRWRRRRPVRKERLWPTLEPVVSSSPTRSRNSACRQWINTQISKWMTMKTNQNLFQWLLGKRFRWERSRLPLTQPLVITTCGNYHLKAWLCYLLLSSLTRQSIDYWRPWLNLYCQILC